MTKTQTKAIILFARDPVAGKVKTRLASQIGSDTAAGLYRNFVTDILAILKSSDVNLRIVFDPPDSKDQFQQWLGKEHQYIPQAGQDLGQRMKNAFAQVFSDGFK